MSSFRSLRAGYLKRCALTIGCIILILVGIISVFFWVQFLKPVLPPYTKNLCRSKGIAKPCTSPEILPEFESDANEDDDDSVVGEDVLIYPSTLYGLVMCFIIICTVCFASFKYLQLYHPEDEMMDNSGDSGRGQRRGRRRGR